MKTILISRTALLSPLIAAAGLLASHPSAEAFLINFDTPGYSDGNNLAGSSQPTGTAWSGGSSSLQIAAGIGVNNTNGMLLVPVTSGNPASLLTPSATVGGDLPGFNGASSILDVQFQFRFTETPAASYIHNVATITFGYESADNAFRFAIRDDGSVTYSNTTSNSQLVKNFQLTSTAEWTQVSARLNYQTQTYTLSINGTLIGEFGFKDDTPGTAITTPALRLQNVGSDTHKQVVFDNIEMTVVPEPTTGSLLIPVGIAGGLLCFKRNLFSLKRQ